MDAVRRSPCASHRRGAESRKRNGAAQANGNSTRRPFQSRRVLLVDDNHDSREMYRAVLRAHGHEVCEAPDGEHALALLQLATDRPLDVAFIDIGLPGGMDGYELARRIRTLPAGREVRLVALTGYGFPKTASNPSSPDSRGISSNPWSRKPCSASSAQSPAINGDIPHLLGMGSHLVGEEASERRPCRDELFSQACGHS